MRLLSVFIGVFVLFMGISKFGWLTDAGVLQSRFDEWHAAAPAMSRWYLEKIAMPGVQIFARVVVIAEISAGVALIVGFRTRLVALLALLMVLNFHFASDVLFHYSYLTNGFGLPVIGSLAALAVGGARLPYSVTK
jgi:uncharacterized membrane protein YphA (DoxX/SURF4 family)